MPSKQISSDTDLTTTITVVSNQNNQKSDYLKQFNFSKYGHIHEQKWTQKCISEFHSSIQLSIFHCTVCQELPNKGKSEIKQSYVCTRCSRDKSVPRRFSNQNLMISSAVPRQLQSLTQVKEMLIARALSIMSVFIKPGGQRAYSGHCVNLPHSVEELANTLPVYPKDIIVKMKGKNNTFKDVNVRRQNVMDALQWLINNNPLYKDVHLNHDCLKVYYYCKQLYQMIHSDSTILPGVQDPDEDLYYNKDTEMTSFLPFPENQKLEMQAVTEHISQTIDWPRVSNEPLSEFTTPYLATLAFPMLFPHARGDY